METDQIRKKTRILLIRCSDEPGLIHRITGFLAKIGANIIGNQEFVEPLQKVFFMRTEYSIQKEEKDEVILSELLQILPKDAELKLSASAAARVVLLATKEAHCLGDILLRWRYGELPMELLGVISNHETLGDLVRDFKLPFTFVPSEGMSREEHEKKVQERLEEMQPDWIVLAKYMRILTPEFVNGWQNRILNIHHSFLPAFVGAKPYEQAYKRGVKIIGGTAHIVTENLDEGPILVQDVCHVDHGYSPERLVLYGRDLEKVVLAKALRLLLEDRVMIFQNRTIIFE
ncbi:formyltetrahydrofolate deformylase [Leptospira langatensis]|uniref:Formyltetrahydrofolate deformylase n=1 Tax=Leptospira langatensis TaxID=2484983 RepID=A0A5F1ZNR3_9LEPT|nr:formyltetrahydrofolate deformylase [Leptospira langatensis]TGK05342.1 formyltetrahydrofolate deformylase [Leptospira langatensis]TGL38478.1 formyltetrahydrofolate deformylase [Leptospira langatensis]